LNPFVSVVVPTYNRLYALAELLESLSRQTYRHFEVIIVNDGGEHIERVTTLYPELQMSVLYAFSNEGDHLSRQMSKECQMYLNRLSEKHGLGKLPTKNFWLLLKEPEVAKRKAGSTIIWDGKPIISRLCSSSN
jgi:cellulose synthase/poly-beta-1,6-N-acetylglucosamine synthase-like glycosyltransferase